MFKERDMFIYIYNSPQFYGKIGIVINVDSNLISVEFDENVGYVEKKRRWLTSASEIKLIKTNKK